MYSVRMRASMNERHISGAERIITEQNISDSVRSLVDRALSHERGKPDFLNISIEELKDPIQNIESLPIKLLDTGDAESGKRAAKHILRILGIPEFCIEKAFYLLESGPSNGESMRGAILMDMQGNRLEPDKQRGIRATRIDITEQASLELANSLPDNLSSYYTQVKEALVLATKVASVKGTVAELCWSDDPCYTAGYVASKSLGYVRIPHLKRAGEHRGGRVFFVDCIDLTDYIHEMQNSPMLVDKFTGIQEFSDHSKFVHDN